MAPLYIVHYNRAPLYIVHYNRVPLYIVHYNRVPRGMYPVSVCVWTAGLAPTALTLTYVYSRCYSRPGYKTHCAIFRLATGSSVRQRMNDE